MSEEYITKECIIEEYLNNWFTYEELSEYLCVDLDEIRKVLDNYCALDKKLITKVRTHYRNIERYYSSKDTTIEITDDIKIYIDIANYIIENEASIRQTAKDFGLGKSTVYDYIQKKLPQISIQHYKEVFDILMKNKSFSTNNKKVIEQVLTSYNYLLKGNTLEQIKDLQHIGINVVQRNLTTRLKYIDKEKYANAKRILELNRMNALKENEFKPHGK